MEDTSAMLMRDFNLLRAHPMEETEIDALKLIRRAISAVEKGLKEEGPVMSAYELVDELAEMQGFVTDSRELFDKVSAEIAQYNEREGDIADRLRRS